MKKFFVNLHRWLKGLPPKPERTGVVFKAWEHTSWGNHIKFFNFDNRQIWGHYLNKYSWASNGKKPYKLSLGDEIQFRMGSGKIARFLIIELKYQADPKDMFFGTVEDIGYVEEELKDGTAIQ